MRSLRAYLPVMALACLLALPAQAMNKAELINEISNKANISRGDALRVLDAFVDVTTRILYNGDRVAMENFGAIGLKHAIAAADGVRSLPEVDFVAGAGFDYSEDAQRDAFKMRVEAAHEAAHVVQQREGVAAMGPGTGSIAVGDIVYLLPGNPSVLAPGRADLRVPLDLMETVRPFVPGDVNDDGQVDALDVQLVINAALGIDIGDDKSPGNRPDNPGQGAPVFDERLRAEVLGVIVLDEEGNRELVREHEGDTIGLLLGGIDKKDIKRGMVIAKPASPTAPGIPEEKEGVWYDAQGKAGAGLRSDGELVQAISDTTGLERRIVVAAYNALLNIIVDQVNAEDKIHLQGFGSFITKSRVKVSVVDPCAGDPENCLQDIADRDLLDTILSEDYIAWEVLLEAEGLERRELGRLADTAMRLAKQAARTGRNPQTGKEIRISAKNVVAFTADAAFLESLR